MSAIECHEYPVVHEAVVQCPVCDGYYRIDRIAHECNIFAPCEVVIEKFVEVPIDQPMIGEIHDYNLAICKPCTRARKRANRPRIGLCPQCNYSGYYVYTDDERRCPACIAAASTTIDRAVPVHSPATDTLVHSPATDTPVHSPATDTPVHSPATTVLVTAKKERRRIYALVVGDIHPQMGRVKRALFLAYRKGHPGEWISSYEYSDTDDSDHTRLISELSAYITGIGPHVFVHHDGATEIWVEYLLRGLSKRVH